MNKDKLLVAAEGLYKTLKSKIAQRNQSLDGNLLKKFAHYYFRQLKTGDPLAELLKLMKQSPEKRGRGFVDNWLGVWEVFQSQKGTLQKFSPIEVAYILGWVARLGRGSA